MSKFCVRQSALAGDRAYAMGYEDQSEDSDEDRLVEEDDLVEGSPVKECDPLEDDIIKRNTELTMIEVPEKLLTHFDKTKTVEVLKEISNKPIKEEGDQEEDGLVEEDIDEH